MSNSESGDREHQRFSFRRFWKEKVGKQPSGAKERPRAFHKPGENPDGKPKIAKTQEGPPSTAEYALHATKKTINILKGVAGLAPIPLVKEVLELGLNIIETCEAVTDVQNRVTALKNRIAGFLLVIAKVTKDSDRDSASKISNDLKSDLLELKDCLNNITTRLQSIQDQNHLLTGLLSEPNLQVIDECESHFHSEVSRFQTLQGLYAVQDLATIQQQLVKLYGITEEMALDVKDTQQRVITIESRVNDLTNMLTKKSEKGTILSRMPKAPDVFFGRDQIVRRLAEQLICGNSKYSRICLVGPGGMGKTSTALAIMEHDLIIQTFTKQYRFWVPCISANSPTLFLAILFKQLRAEQKTGDPLEDIIASLQETTEPRIILLDNFETPWHPIEGSQSTIRLVLEALDELPHVSILITMRSDFSPLERWTCEKLSQVSPDDSRKIYTAIDASAGNYPELGEIVDALGHLPYAITLMASRGKRSFANPRQLLEEWRGVGTSMLSRSEEGMDHSISLSIDSRFVCGSPGALRLLQILSMLPAGVYFEHLSTWANGWQSEALDTLRDAALVLAREVNVGDVTRVHLFVLPVVQSYMKHNDRIPKEVEQQVFTSCYRFLAQNSIKIEGPNDPNFNQRALAIASQEANIQPLLTIMVKDSLVDADPPPYASPISPNLVTQIQRLEAFLSFSWYQCWTKPRPEITEHVLAVARASGDTQYEANALFCLGVIYRALLKHKDASEAFTKAQMLFERLDDDLMTLRSESRAIESQTQFLPSFHVYTLITIWRARWMESPSPNSAQNAWSRFYSGYLHWWRNNHTDALEDFEAAQQMFGQLNPPCKFEMAFSGYYVARTRALRGDNGDYEAAFSAINTSICGVETLYGEGLVGPDSFEMYNIKARILKGLDRWDDELVATLKVALQYYQEAGDSAGIAFILVELAEVYVREEDWPAAELAYQEVIKKLAGLEDNLSVEFMEHARNNLSYIAHVSAKERFPADYEGNGVYIELMRPPRG